MNKDVKFDSSDISVRCVNPQKTRISVIQKDIDFHGNKTFDHSDNIVIIFCRFTENTSTSTSVLWWMCVGTLHGSMRTL